MGSTIKVSLVAITVRVIYAGAQIVTKMALNRGTNASVFIFYQQAFSFLFLAPFALLFERKTALQMPPLLCFKIFAFALLLNTGCANLFTLGLDNTSTTLAAASMNTIPVLTFTMAVFLRMETVNVKRLTGVAKLCGVALCVAGIATIALYKGPDIIFLNHHQQNVAHDGTKASTQLPKSRRTFLIGTSMVFLASIVWSLWPIVQGWLLKDYPSMLLLTTFQSLFSAMQSVLLALAVERDLSKWKLGFNMGLFAAAYGGILVFGASLYLQSWVIREKGPVFVQMFAPLTLAVTIPASLFIGEKINLESILGGGLMVGGLYCVLLGKIKGKMESKTITAEDGIVLFAEKRNGPPSNSN